VKANLRAQFERLDPVRLLRDIRAAQRLLAELAGGKPEATVQMAETPSELSAFLDGLATAWKDGEVRPTHRRQLTATRWWKTRADPFEHACFRRTCRDGRAA